MKGAIIPISQMRNLSHREVSFLAQGHSARKLPNWDSHPGYLAPDPTFCRPLRPKPMRESFGRFWTRKWHVLCFKKISLNNGENRFSRARVGRCTETTLVKRPAHIQGHIVMACSGAPGGGKCLIRTYCGGMARRNCLWIECGIWKGKKSHGRLVNFWSE